ncbi:hypothetical protein EMIT0232MI5_10387 [Pseudomonas sp. IT-232MI5]
MLRNNAGRDNPVARHHAAARDKPRRQAAMLLQARCSAHRGAPVRWPLPSPPGHRRRLPVAGSYDLLRSDAVDLGFNLHAVAHDGLTGTAFVPAIDFHQAALAHAHAAVGAGDLVVIITGNLANAEGLDNAEDGFTNGGGDRLAVDMDGHIRLRQRLDIESSFLAVHCDVHP